MHSISFNNDESLHINNKISKVDYLENNSNEPKSRFSHNRSENVQDNLGNSNKSNIINNNSFATNNRRMSKSPNQHAMPTNGK